MKKDFIKINNYEDFKEQYRILKDRISQIDTNCLLPGKTIRECLEQGDVYLENFPQGMVVYTDEDVYDRIFYFLDREQEFPRINSARPLLLEEVDSNDRRKEYLEWFAKKLFEKGFELEAKNLQVQMDLLKHEDWIYEQFDKAEKQLHENGLAAGYYHRESQKKEITDLWKSYLKPSDVPVSHTFFDIDKDQTVLCVEDEKGTLCGVNWWIYRGSTCEIRHTVTHPDYYRKGIGNYMMLKSLKDALLQGCHLAIGYADVLNDKSLGMLEKTGFEKNGKTSLQFVRVVE